MTYVETTRILDAEGYARHASNSGQVESLFCTRRLRMNAGFGEYEGKVLCEQVRSLGSKRPPANSCGLEFRASRWWRLRERDARCSAFHTASYAQFVHEKIAEHEEACIGVRWF